MLIGTAAARAGAATTVVAPSREQPPGFAPIATVTVPRKPVAVFPSASCAVTCSAGVIAAPAVALLGCPLNTSCVATPGVTVNAALVAPVNPLALAVRV